MRTRRMRTFIAAAGLAAAPAIVNADEFTIIALPDTQNYVNNANNAPLFTQQTQWIVDQIQTEGNPDNIVFVTHLGDVVSDGDNATQIARAETSLAVLDGGLPESVIPWSVLPGNHDYASTGDKSTGTDAYVESFGPARFDGKSWFGGAEASGNNTYQFFQGDGVTYLHIALEWRPTINVTNGPTRDPSPIAWAQSVISANPGVPVIISTHENLDDNPPGRSGAGEALWNELVRRNDQVIMVLNGHYHSAGGGNDGEYHQVSTNDFGKPVIEVLQDYQDYPNGGDGWLRIITFDPDTNQVHFQTYSPVLDEFQTETVKEVGQFASEFSLGLDFVTRFDFADPPEPPTPVFETILIQQGEDGYEGTDDKEIRSSGGDEANGEAPEISVDGDDGSPGLQPNQGLVRFNGLIGDAEGQLPPNKDILSAFLQLNVTNPGSGMQVYQMTAVWDESTTWLDLDGDGVTPGVDTLEGVTTEVGEDNSSANIGTGLLSLDITAAVESWIAGGANEGVALVPFTNGSNGIDFDSSEGNVPPALLVRRLLPGLELRSFRQGFDAYLGAADTQIRQADPDTNYGAATSVSLDADDPDNQQNQVLIKFAGVFTDNQVPQDREIVRAFLVVHGFNPGDGGALHRLLSDWDENAITWNSAFGGDGIQADDAEAVAASDTATAGATGRVEIDVTASLRAWQEAPATNFGWVMLPSGTDGWDFYTADAGSALRPELIVVFRDGVLCAADWDGNGVVNAADVGSFLSAYFLDLVNGTLVTDFDGNGIVNAADVGSFLSAYFTQLNDPECNDS